MVDADPRLTARLAYQRALAALHDARADLADLAAARRRLAYQRTRLDPADAAARDAELADRHDALAAAAERLRMQASELRVALRRFSDDSAEPPDLRPDGAPDGFEQPPFGESER